MSVEETFSCYISAYYGVREMDSYPLKEYVLYDLEKYIKAFVLVNSFSINLYEKAMMIEESVSLKTKLQDALIVLPKIHASLEFILMIKERIQEISQESI